jgi:MinD superfamily P-loop ATPase
VKQIVVISGKGGTGKTSITSGLASVAAPLVLADCDVDAADLHLVLKPNVRETHEFESGVIADIDPDLCTHCGICIQACRFGAITEDIKIRSGHCEGCGACAYVCPAKAVRLEPRLCGAWYLSETRCGPMVHAALDIGAENSGKLVSLVRIRSEQTAKEHGLNFVLVDGPPGIGCSVIASLTGADVALIVAEPTVSALHDMERVAQLLAYFKISASILLNKCNVSLGLAQRVRDYCRQKNLPLVGEIPLNPLCVQAQLQGKTIAELDPQGLGQILKGIWKRLAET